MFYQHQHSGKAVSVPKGLGLSLAVNIALTAALCMITASLVALNKIEWYRVGYCIMFMLLFVSYIGAKTAISAIKTQFFMIALMSGILYWLFLLSVTALFFGGNYSSIPETAALIAAGSISAALLRRSKRTTIPRKRRNTYR